MDNLSDIIKKCQADMKKALEHTFSEFNSLHTGKASPAMVETVTADVYGSSMKLNEVAAITTPDARTIVVEPWDKSTLEAISKAITVANIGLNPSVNGGLIRCPVPEMSKERRQDLVKVAGGMAEEGRIGVRAARRDAMEALKKLESVSEDEIKMGEKDVQKETDNANQQIAKALEQKEADLMQV